MILDYDGTNYSGWQAQPNTSHTIQGILEKALGILAGGSSVGIVGCGRTDAGVHARGYVAHFDGDYQWAPADLCHKVNRLLPYDILVVDISIVHDHYHARYDATSRTYNYRLRLSPDVFDRRFTTRYPYDPSSLDMDLVQAPAQLLLGQHDFTAFCKTGSDINHARCTVTRSAWQRDGEVWVYTVTANRFLRGMIRLVVGMCLNVSRGHLTIEEVAHALQHPQRLSTDWSVPPEGLMLCDIEYEV